MARTTIEYVGARLEDCLKVAGVFSVMLTGTVASVVIDPLCNPTSQVRVNIV